MAKAGRPGLTWTWTSISAISSPMNATLLARAIVSVPVLRRSSLIAVAALRWTAATLRTNG